MRQIHVDVPEHGAREVLSLAAKHHAVAPVATRAWHEDGTERVLVFVNLPNPRVGSFAEEVATRVDDAQITIVPQGVIPVSTPLSDVAGQVAEVGHRSTMELVLSALQSIGSWQGMLQYAFFSGLVAAYGIIVGASYLLVAAMLIAPMGAPAMVSVVGAAIGDWKMVGRGAARFFASIAVLVISAAALGYAYRLSASTALMEQVTELSAWGVLLAVVAGAAGAQSQVEGNRSSLVTGTATGFLIAAALSPTSAVLGLSFILRRWDYAQLMLFQLALQYVAIVSGGWLAVNVYGVGPKQPSMGRGSLAVRRGIAAAVMLATIGLAFWQTQHGPRFLKADYNRDIATVARRAVQALPGVRFVEGEAYFTANQQTDIPQESVVVRLLVANETAAMPSDSLASRVRERVHAALRDEIAGIAPFVVVSVVPGPLSER